MADNNTSDQSGEEKNTGVHPPASEELPGGGPFHEGQNQDDLSTCSNKTTLTDIILNVSATGSDKTDTEANALTAHSDTSVPVTGGEANAPMTHSDANKVSNSECKFYESLPDSGAVTPEISSKIQGRKQEDLQSGGEHSDTRFKKGTPSHDSIQSSGTTVLPDDRREINDSKRSPDIAGTPGNNHKGEDEDLTGSSDIASTPGESHEGEVEDLTGSSDIASMPGDRYKEDNDLTRSHGVTGFSQYSDHLLPERATIQFSPERAGANQTPASPSTSVVDNPGSPVVMSTPDNKFRNSPLYESESGISQRESGIWSSQNEFSMRHYHIESGLGYSPSESGIEMSFNDEMSKNSEEKTRLEENKMEKRVQKTQIKYKILKDKRVKKTIVLEERIKELEAKIRALEEEKKLQGKHAEELQNLLQEKAGLLKEIDDLQDLDVKNWKLQKDIEERGSNIKRLQDKIEDLKEAHKKEIQSLQEELRKSREHPHSNETSKEIADRIKELEKQINDKESLYQGSQNEVERLQKIADRIKELEKQINDKEILYQGSQNEVERLQTENANQSLGLKQQIDEKEKQLQNLQDQMKQLNEKHAKDVESLQKELNESKQWAVKLQKKIVYLQDTMAQCEKDLASNKLILNNALLRELREKEEKDKCQHIIEEKRAEEVKILQERDRLEAELQSCRTKAKSSRTRCLLWKCVTYLRTLQLKNLENVYEGIVSEFEEQKRFNTTMQRALAESQEELDELNSKLQDERDAVSELQQDKATLEEKNAVLQDSHQQAKDQVSDRDQQIEKLKAQRKQLEKLKAKSDEQVMQAQAVNNTLQMQVVKLQHERVRENTLNESKISELTAQIRQREQQFLPLEMQVQQTMQELGSAHSRLEEVQDCNRTLKEELHKATAALTERGRQEEALQSKIQDLSLKNSRYLHELFTVRRDLSVVTEKLRRTEVWMR